MTTMPYKMSAFLLIFSLIESIVDLYFVSRRTVQLNSDPTQFSWSNTILVFVSYFKICSIQYFFVARAFEQTILYIFVYFQSRYHLQQIQIVKDKYNCIERRLETCFKWLANFFWIPMLGIYIKYLIEANYTDAIYSASLWTLSLFFMLWLYTASSVNLLYIMWR